MTKFIYCSLQLPRWTNHMAKENNSMEYNVHHKNIRYLQLQVNNY